MSAFALAPEALVVIAIVIGLAWLFEDRAGVNKGLILGPYEWILKTNRIYIRPRRAVSDVSHEIFQNPEPIFAEVEQELKSPEFKEDYPEEFKQIASAFNKVNPKSIFYNPDFGFQAFVLGGLLRAPMLVYVISRKRDKKTGEPRPFPSGQALVAKRPVITASGLQSRRLVEGSFVLLPKSHRMEGLFRRNIKIGLFISDDDSRDPEVIAWMEKVLPLLQTVANGIRTERQFGLLLKDVIRQLKGSQSEVKKLVNSTRTKAGASIADEKTTEWYQSVLPRARKITNSFTPFAMFGFPIFGAVLFEYVFRSNAIFGVILGAAIPMAILGSRGT